MKNVFLGVIAVSLAILAAPTVIDAYKTTAKDIQTKHRASTRQAKAEKFCDSNVVISQQRVFNQQAGINDLDLNGARQNSYKEPARLATREQCIALFGRYDEYMPVWRKGAYPDA